MQTNPQNSSGRDTKPGPNTELEPAVDSFLDDLEKEHSESKFQREQFKAYLMIPETRSKK